MNIRLATINDLNEIYYIEEKVFNDYWSIDLIESELKDQEHSEVSVLEINKKIIGYIFQRKIFDDNHIINLAIDIPYQHKGYGRFLLMKILEKDKNDTNVFLEVKEANLPAIKLYIDLGFEEVDRKDRYYSDGSNAIFMLRRNKKYGLV
ncbi:MAG: ribosomal protein S18-alanine N-acetyltransferase [Candidatus Neomarinimicrobiota bacterium]|jgi:ribosomal-protein-alanine N-acetyltransferase|nr:ribosomal protein S18-alanine N-acetyltransferase [Candidatus Neomarinimicrobiota bacterium]MEE3302865.1 ribosomal protein S18-alanine N-acetyltransferase [Candidatus Neomarinimicrobiota bacterium]|tara:strand:+ start:368 stop:814 length:447 start_codon:yes stop_codon:yes gene_type:complete